LGLTVTVAVVVLIHPAAEVLVIVYIVVTVGLATTEAPVVIFNPVAGDQEYDIAFVPVAVNIVDDPLQIVTELTVIFGFGLTVTTPIAEALHLIQFFTTPVTVYEVVVDGDTLIELVVAPLLQVYEAAPLAVNIAVWPWHIVAELTVIKGTVTLETAVLEQPFINPVTVYEAEAFGEAIAVLGPIEVTPELHI